MIERRSSGILLPISSLPSNYGIGTLGKEAYNFIDFLVKANQSYWQILPIGPTSLGDSPYQSFSSFATNPYFIDLDILIEEGLLTKADLSHLESFNEAYVEYGYLYNTRYEILRKAYKCFQKTNITSFEEYCLDNRKWLDDYALFMALKKHFDNKCWLDWPDKEIRLKEKTAVEKYRKLLEEDINFYKFLQFKFNEQYNKLRKYAHKNGIKIIGDLPIYVSLDSSDVWANPDQFLLDKENIPSSVAGVPPDYFSEDGQLWGNPLYNWEKMKENGYKFWIERIDASSKYYDVIRIDHFRGFAQYWAVKYGEKTAKKGQWIDGPGYPFIEVIKNWFRNVDFIAEDLGIIDSKVEDLLNKSGFPGMRVLEFGFSEKASCSHTPYNHKENGVCYIATHDNSPIMGWIDTTGKEDFKYAKKYLNLTESEGYNWGFIRCGMNSVCKLFICQMQDYLGLHEEARTNTPGTLGNNWKWRLTKNQIDEKLVKKISDITEMYGRERKNNK